MKSYKQFLCESPRSTIDSKMEAIMRHLDALHKLTKPGSSIHAAISAHGGDASGVADLHKHIKKAFSVAEDAHRFAAFNGDQ